MATYTSSTKNRIIEYTLIATEKRITFDINYQHPDTIHRGLDEDGWKYVASNGYEIMSRSRMDIQTERIWLLGASEDTRSGSMVFSSNEKRDIAFKKFEEALDEWILATVANFE